MGRERGCRAFVALCRVKADAVAAEQDPLHFVNTVQGLHELIQQQLRSCRSVRRVGAKLAMCACSVGLDISD